MSLGGHDGEHSLRGSPYFRCALAHEGARCGSADGGAQSEDESDYPSRGARATTRRRGSGSPLLQEPSRHPRSTRNSADPTISPTPTRIPTQPIQAGRIPFLLRRRSPVRTDQTPSEEIAEMLADPDSEVLVHRPEHDEIRLPLSAFKCRVSVHASEQGNEVDPPQETEHLHERSQDSESHHGDRDDSGESERPDRTGRPTGTRRSPDSMNIQNRRTSVDPPAWNRSRISAAGLLRMFG